MENLYQKSNIDFTRLKQSLLKIASKELSNLTEPCYYPELKKYYFELLNDCKLKDSDIKVYTDEFWKGRPENSWLLHKDRLTMFYIFLIYVSLKNKDLVAAKTAMLLFNIRYYTNLINKQIKHCNNQYFKVALERISKAHLFYREQSISNAITFLSKEMEKFFPTILSQNKDEISKFITASRHRISQSIKSFAEVYYKVKETGGAIKEPYEGEENEFQFRQADKSIQIITYIIKKITMYKLIDERVLNNAKKLSKISNELARLLVKELSDTKYSDDIKTVLDLFLRELKDMDLICSGKYFLFLRKLMASKEKFTLNFKQAIIKTSIKLIKGIEYEEKFKKMSNQTQFLIYLFVAYYITLVLKQNICYSNQ